ncbi:uncharacterized protein A4U43_C07F28270 [Asparagus officinalis]|uniref:Uncharacterized protein n=1 Tax=Asparagus officinalis TaxID=4686 RepID=A0A5P1EKR9_ASPOF|nr:uncharacterized protein A4U43_C07F28270 [Asparagus officinalis]
MMMDGSNRSVNSVHHSYETVDLAIEDIEQKQPHGSMLAICMRSSLRTSFPLEEQAHNALIPISFKNFQEEFTRATQYVVFEYFTNKFVVQYYKEESSQKQWLFGIITWLLLVSCILRFGD